MKSKELVALGGLAALLVWSVAWAQQTPQAQEPQGSSPSAMSPATSQNSPQTSMKNGKTKEKHWTGSLVDVKCMASALRSTGATPGQNDASGMPHFMGSNWVSPQAGGQMPAGGGQSGAQMPSQAGPTQTGPGGQTPSTVTNPQVEAKMAQEEQVDNAAKQCTPSPSTQVFGLAMSDGQVVQFDKNGDTLAQGALKDNAVQSGKKIKAKVTGTMQSETMVKVASLDVKGKGKRASGGQ